MDASFTLFDHTADIGLRIIAESRPALLPPASQALYAVIGDLKTSGTPQTRGIDMTDGDPAELLRDYLNELLLVFEREQRIVTRVVCETFEYDHLTAAITTELVDPEHSTYHREVKAITYHELAIVEAGGGFEATVIVDI